ncbi:amidohydrolase family protein [Gluconacetobacter azotocaptans]|uniref:dihydroorotase n=1 Tax=Gluconacetobacter azotocaptans TaxID=142834 RepID=UPI00195E0A88|nr:amidohydrolase family protein [Gluconacetobacter azotocaptans]MBM9402559.1 amidohydrolase family protein [Gluconacetobacter azotocaptans]
MHDLLFQGRVVTTSAVLEEGWVAVDDGRISRLGQGTAPAARRVEDHGDALILPGAIDAQVHSRSQKGQEDFLWSTRAAAAGGVTTIADMPYDDGFLVSTADKLRQKAHEAGEQARVDFALWGTIAPDDGPHHIPDMARAGACGFKFSTFGTDPVRFPRIPPDLLAACFEAVARTGLIAGVHNEDDELVRARIDAVIRSGITDWRAHGLSRPALAETLAMAQIYETAAGTGCSAHVVHCSVARGYALCESYRRQGFDTTVEACIHYLVLDEEHDVARLGGRAKINPPIRPRAEVEGIWAHLAAGNVTIVSTDHVSWSQSRKSDPVMLKNASGAPGLEVLYPLLLTELSRRDLCLSNAARLLAENPARLFRLTAGKGGLSPGRDADITIARRESRQYDPTASGHAFADWSPYAGRELDWRIAATWLRGQQIFDGQSVSAEPGTGRFICPDQPSGRQ